MTLPASLLSRLHWLNLPGVLLIALLQRTPVLRVLATGAEHLATSPAGQIMRSVFTLGTLGALHSLAGATTFIATQGTNEIIRVSTAIGSTPRRSPATGTANTAITPVAFTYTGTPSEPQYYAITGQLPPGLSFVPAPTLGVVRARAPSITGTPTQAGTYTIRVQGFGLGGNGQPEPIEFTITGGATATVPAFSVQPANQSVMAGSSVTLTATATGSPQPAYQWRRNGTPLEGATAASLTLPSVQTADAGDYTVVATNSAGTVTSAAAALTVVASSSGARLANLSVRTTLAAGQNLIVGLAVNGGNRNILVRAAGPALAAVGLPASVVMADPQLELYDDRSIFVMRNDNWSADLAATFASVGAFPFPAGSRDAAFVQSVNAVYSIHTRGTGSGMVIVEAYDTSAPSAARLLNVSARNHVGTGDDILIAGFNISGTGNMPLLIRAIGPKLTAFGVTGTLVDPMIEIYDNRDTKVAQNDNWSGALAPTFISVGAFPLDNGSRDAALLVSLPSGSYTALVRGSNGGTGEALIEIYEVR